VIGAADFTTVLTKLPQGLEQPLGKSAVDGQELSAGEWQRLALARTLAHEAEFVILDEPTSALDPWAEADWMSRLRASQAGRTILVITHRLAVAQRADHLIFLEGGRVMEQGSPAASSFLAKMGNT
jgi:ATP-binding cassette, subfamily B, bacterial